MRTLLETTPVRMTLIDKWTGRPVDGFASLVVTLFDPNERVPRAENMNVALFNPRPISALRTESGAGRPILASPGGQFVHFFSPIPIPESLIAGIPETASLSFQWHFNPDVK